MSHSRNPVRQTETGQFTKAMVYRINDTVRALFFPLDMSLQPTSTSHGAFEILGLRIPPPQLQQHPTIRSFSAQQICDGARRLSQEVVNQPLRRGGELITSADLGQTPRRKREPQFSKIQTPLMVAALRLVGQRPNQRSAGKFQRPRILRSLVIRAEKNRDPAHSVENAKMVVRLILVIVGLPPIPLTDGLDGRVDEGENGIGGGKWRCHQLHPN